MRLSDRWSRCPSNKKQKKNTHKKLTTKIFWILFCEPTAPLATNCGANCCCCCGCCWGIVEVIKVELGIIPFGTGAMPPLAFRVIIWLGWLCWAIIWCCCCCEATRPPPNWGLPRTTTCGWCCCCCCCGIWWGLFTLSWFDGARDDDDDDDDDWLSKCGVDALLSPLGSADVVLDKEALREGGAGGFWMNAACELPPLAFITFNCGCCP